MVPDTGALWPLDYDQWEMDEGGTESSNKDTVMQTAACRSPVPETGLASENEAHFDEGTCYT